MTCHVTEKPLENTAVQRDLRLRQGWNLVVLSLIPDAASLEKLSSLPAMTLDETTQSYVMTDHFTAHGLYWLYTPAARRLLLTGEACESDLPQADNWTPFGAYPARQLEDYTIWNWQDGRFVSPADHQTVPGQGYFVRKLQ